ncbi:MAG: hypothetical protein A4E73_02500 [Syntrophaceae bacterium PtaU1.Bin231]|nr:MAG: hypothetical protein A4E73_02500 [Syntrophaceae bacterium PtaU1.Bin231]
MKEETTVITPETVILDIISRHRETEAVFKKLEEETGTCVCCQALFLPLGEAAARFGFDLDRALDDILGLIRTT